MKLLPLVKDGFHAAKAPVDIYQEEIKADSTMQDILDACGAELCQRIYLRMHSWSHYASEHNVTNDGDAGGNRQCKRDAAGLCPLNTTVCVRAAITQQITEVIGGAKAQKKKKKK